MMFFDDIVTAILNERSRQDALFPDQDPTLGKWLAILTEEVGEVAKAILDLQEANDVGSARQRKLAREHLVEELVQVAAVAVHWVEKSEP